MKRAVLYQNNKKTIIHPFSKTVDGLWIWDNPIYVFEKINIDDETLKAILETLSHSRSSVEHPRNWKGFYDPVLKKAGIQSMRKFFDSMKSVEFELENNVLKLIPMENLGSKEGFQPIKEQIVLILLENINASLVSSIINPVN